MVIHNAFAPGSVYRLSPAPQTRGWPFIKLHLSVDRQCKQCPLGVLLCHCLDPISCRSSRVLSTASRASVTRQSIAPTPIIQRTTLSSHLPGAPRSALVAAQPGVERRCQRGLHCQESGVCEMCASRISHKSQSSSLCHRIHGSQGDAWLRRRADAAARAGLGKGCQV